MVPQFQFPTEALQKVLKPQAKKKPGITANLSSKPQPPPPFLPADTTGLLSYPLTRSLVGIRLKSGNWKTQGIIREFQKGIISIQGEGHWCRTGLSTQNKSLVNTEVYFRMWGLSVRLPEPVNCMWDHTEHDLVPSKLANFGLLAALMMMHAGSISFCINKLNKVVPWCHFL